MRQLFRMALLIALGASLYVLPAGAQGSLPTAEDGRPDQTVLWSASNPFLPAERGYLSPPTEAARPFTHMLLRREARIPDGAAMTLFTRVSTDGATWSDWGEVNDNEDLWRPQDGPDVEWSQTIDVGGRVRFWQIRAEFVPAPDGARPELRRIEVNTVDALSFGPATIRTPGQTPSGAAPASLAKPAVISRTEWGNPDGQGSRVPPDYYPVNHMVVHHTADSNTLLPSEPNWAARVRAEWSFHTYSRGWGDVGYNYLIDPNGVIYEGRAGGDDAVAFHDTANYGSMGVVLIGTYAAVPPTDGSQTALVNLLAWKSAQKRIDPLGSSYYYGCAISRFCYPYNPGAVVANIAGHRQATPGHTSCPGDKTMNYLPGIRNRVKQALSGSSADNGDLVIDNLEEGGTTSGFAKSAANWHEAACGYGSHTYWTYATDGAAENSATWRPNIPSAGRYRVYAYIPQGCRLASPPYTSTKASYRITHAGGMDTTVVDHTTATEWVDLGAYQFNQGVNGAVELYDTTGEPLSAGKILFFDAIKWVPEDPGATNVALLNVRYDRTTLTSGELLKVTFTVKNTGSTTLHSQQPQASLTADGSAYNDGASGRPDDSYAYDQGECFIGDSDGNYSAFPKESDRFRVVLGPTNSGGIACAGNFGGYPWRWGLNGSLAPGATRDVVGYVRFRAPGSYTLKANIIQEYVKYYYDQQQGFNTTTITVTAEQFTPDVARYNSVLQPLARVYRLGSVPDNLLARTRNSLSIPRGDYIGDIAWDGSLIDWGSGGPLGQTDQFIIEQTRSFHAPWSGVYTFRASSDDGSWLWVDGVPVVVNNGLHATSDVTGAITLNAGVHSISFKYFERYGLAAMGYSVQYPGGSSFGDLIDAIGGGALRFGGAFATAPIINITADDQGGDGIDRIRWSWDGITWTESQGALLALGKLTNGSYRLRYQAIDNAENAAPLQELVFTVNTNLTVYRRHLPVLMR